MRLLRLMLLLCGARHAHEWNEASRVHRLLLRLTLLLLSLIRHGFGFDTELRIQLAVHLLTGRGHLGDHLIAVHGVDRRRRRLCLSGRRCELRLGEGSGGREHGKSSERGERLQHGELL
ncbi:MAG: hypothetical protein WAU68_11130 [Vitreimonas sp.]